MSQILRVTPVVGLPQFTGWSHVFEHIIDPETRCVFCFSISGENASNVGREVVDSILAIPPRSAQGLYQVLEDSSKIVSGQNCELSMVAGVFRHKRSILAAVSGSIILKRDQKVGKIIESANEIALIEGKFDLDDVFVFSTLQAKEFLSEIELQFARGFDSDGVITSIVPALHALDDSSLSALGFLVVTDEEIMADMSPTVRTFQLEASDDDNSEESQPLITVEHEKQAPAVNQVVNEREMPDAVRLTTASEKNVVSSNKGMNVFSLFKQAVIGIGQFFKWLIKKLLQALFEVKSLFSSKTYVGSPPRKKIITWVIAVAVGIMIVVGAFWWRSSEAAKNEASIQAAVSPFESKLAQIEQSAEGDPIPAREQAATLISTLQAQLSEAEAIGDKKRAMAFSEVLDKAKATYQDISGRDEVSELPIFYDLRLVSSDFITSIAGTNNQIAYFIDREKKQAIVLDVSTKQVSTQNLESIGQVTSVSAGSDENSMLLLADGIYLQSVTADAEPSLVKEQGDSNRGGTLIESFGSYVYVFNPEKRNIYRYITSDEGEQYSDPIGWLLDPLGASFESITSWAIDGEIWMGTTTGQILRFASGREESFAIVGLQDPFESMLRITTKEDVDAIWVLEHEKNRVVILNKQGEFLREVKSSSLGAATDIILDQSGNSAFIVSGSSVFQISL